MVKRFEDHRINEQIRSRYVRLIAQDGKQIGIVSLPEALNRARSEGLDLVEVAPNADPPVCRIMDYGKLKYQAKKRSQEAKKKAKTINIKEIRLRPRIDDHDLAFKLNNIRKFLSRNDKVKITLMFRGRERAYMENGVEILRRVAEELSDVGVIDQAPKAEGWRMTMVIAPKS